MNDKAERLHSLIEKLHSTAHDTTVKESGTTMALVHLPLWKSFNLIAAKLGYADYGDFHKAFLVLCQSVNGDVSIIPMQKETVRASWLACIKNVSSVFDAKNFGSSTADVFSRHFSRTNMDTLDAISERFQAAELRESTPTELEDALGAVREAIEAFKASGKLNGRVAAVLNHYLQQMESVYSHVRDFGDETFWKLYKETFATFMQLHPVIVSMDNADEIKGKISVVAEKLTSKSVAGISLTANLATIGTSILPMLGFN